MAKPKKDPPAVQTAEKGKALRDGVHRAEGKAAAEGVAEVQPTAAQDEDQDEDEDQD